MTIMELQQSAVDPWCCRCHYRPALALVLCAFADDSLLFRTSAAEDPDLGLGVLVTGSRRASCSPSRVSL